MIAPVPVHCFSISFISSFKSEADNGVMSKIGDTGLYWGRTGLVVRASDSGSGDPGSIRCVVSLSKRHLLPKGTGNSQE